jgi:hypothetical protein
MSEVENYQNKTLDKFTETDTFYMKKMDHGYDVHLLCRFVSFGKCMVVGVVVDTPKFRQAYLGKTVHARADKCYLWGKAGCDAKRSAHCIWFDRSGKLVIYK